MQEVWLKPDKVEALYGIPQATLRRLCNQPSEKRELAARKTFWGKRQVWEVEESSIKAYLSKRSKTLSYQDYLAEWKQQQETGLYTGKPLKPETIERNEYGVKSFWHWLGAKESIEAMTIANIRQAIANAPKDKPATKENIYKGCMSFYKFLVAKELRPYSHLMEFKGFKPAGNKRPRRTVIKSIDTFHIMIDFNRTWKDSRSDYDQLLTETILLFLWHTGARNSEMCNLMLEHVDFTEGILYIYKGKGDQDRKIGLSPELDKALKRFLEHRASSEHKNFLLQRSGRPLNRRVVADRIKELCLKLYVKKEIKIDITAHGFRRSLITQLLLDGTPTSKVKLISGHKKLATLQLYDMSEDEDALDVLRHRTQAIPQQEKPKDPAPENKKALRNKGRGIA